MQVESTTEKLLRSVMSVLHR